MISTQNKQRVCKRIDKTVDKILRELGNPEPPIDLQQVRELLELDLSYFNSDTDDFLTKSVSRIKRAGKLIIKKPTLVIDAIKKFDLKALYVPDRKKIIIDETAPTLKQRWLEGHEIGHSILPWHDSIMLGDDEITPTASTHSKMEIEANYAAGSLLFLSDRFKEESLSSELTIANILIHKKKYGNTITTTFWRAIETYGEQIPVFGLIGEHPSKFDRENPAFKHFITSRQFTSQFHPPNLKELENKISAYCYRSKGPLGEGEIELQDLNGELHTFKCETFYNGYNALTLATYEKKIAPKICISLADVV